jgi:hypothetical protein
MRFLRRGGDSGSTGGTGLDDQLAAFWAWWAGARDPIATAIEDGTLDQWTSPISRAVEGVHKQLAWELAKGHEAKHMLVVSPEGNAELRPIALRWAQSAPVADTTWEYHPSRQAGPLGKLVIAGAEVDLAGMHAVTSWDETRERLAVRLWHPAFEALPERARHQVAFLFLDNLVGEDQVERWVGTIDVDPAAQAGRTPDELRAELERRSGEATGEQWALLQGDDGRGGVMIVRLNASLKRIDHPFADKHLAVSVERGLDVADDKAQNDAIAAAEEELEGLMAGLATEAAHVTDRKRRLTHFVCEDGDPALEAARDWADRHRQWGTKATLRPDPHWEFRRSYGE